MRGQGYPMGRLGPTASAVSRPAGRLVLLAGSLLCVLLALHLLSEHRDSSPADAHSVASATSDSAPAATHSPGDVDAVAFSASMQQHNPGDPLHLTAAGCLLLLAVGAALSWLTTRHRFAARPTPTRLDRTPRRGPPATLPLLLCVQRI